MISSFVVCAASVVHSADSGWFGIKQAGKDMMCSCTEHTQTIQGWLRRLAAAVMVTHASHEFKKGNAAQCLDRRVKGRRANLKGFTE